jgi:catechol 2,3-dioxygenase-like lactoylglutathione lyase family enzyme
MPVVPRGIQHIGVPVKSLRRSLAFYKEMFDLEPEFTHTGEGEDLSRGTGVPNAKLTLAFFQLGNTYLELLEYHTPRDEVFAKQNCDVGATHICFEVDDIQASYQELLDKGVEFYSPPILIDGGPLDGYWWCYFKDPDGITLEFFQLP